MGSAIIEVGLGLVMVFFVLSVVITQINNVIINSLNLRAESLRAWFHQAISDEGLRNQIMAHPMIGIVQTQMSFRRPNRFRRLANRLGRRMLGILVPGAEKYDATTEVAYVAPSVFADVLVGTLIQDEQPQTTMEEEKKVEALAVGARQRAGFTPLEQMLETILASSTSFQDAHTKVADWYENATAHMSNLFRQRVQRIAFAVGMLLSIALNVDALYLARTLWNDPALRQTVLYAAESAAQSHLEAGATSDADLERVRQTLQSFLDLRLPIGWELDASAQATALSSPRNLANFSPVANPDNWFGFLVYKLAGWLLTTLAIMQGSDFWFNLLGRLTAARTAVTRISETISSGQSGQQSGGGVG